MSVAWRSANHLDAVFAETDLEAIAEAGASGVVTALFHVHPDTAWEPDEILALKARIEGAGLTWDVGESIPVPSAVTLGGAGRDAGIV